MDVLLDRCDSRGMSDGITAARGPASSSTARGDGPAEWIGVGVSAALLSTSTLVASSTDTAGTAALLT
jgi:hypothetical protein